MSENFTATRQDDGGFSCEGMQLRGGDASKGATKANYDPNSENDLKMRQIT
jgi:hypothetical protein